jgi:corrinoid protein of di/trimethylamine methyltransferase
MSKEEIYEKLAQAVVNYNAKDALKVCEEAIENGISPVDAIQKGLNVGMKQVGQAFSDSKIPLPVVILAAKAMSQSIEYLKTKMTKEERFEPIGRFLLGVVEGDIHDIGAKILMPILEIAGFEVKYIGIDVPIKKFIEEAEKFKPDIIGLSSFMTTTMTEQERFIRELNKLGMRKKYKVMVGGGPISEDWKNRIHADGYAPDAPQTAEIGKKLIGK